MRGRFCRAMVLLLLAAGLAGILLAAPEAHAQATSPTPKRPAETGLIIFPPPKEWPEDAIDRLTRDAENAIRRCDVAAFYKARAEILREVENVRKLQRDSGDITGRRDFEAERPWDVYRAQVGAWIVVPCPRPASRTAQQAAPAPVVVPADPCRRDGTAVVRSDGGSSTAPISTPRYSGDDERVHAAWTALLGRDLRAHHAQAGSGQVSIESRILCVQPYGSFGSLERDAGTATFLATETAGVLSGPFRSFDVRESGYAGSAGINVFVPLSPTARPSAAADHVFFNLGVQFGNADGSASSGPIDVNADRLNIAGLGVGQFANGVSLSNIGGFARIGSEQFKHSTDFFAVTGAAGLPAVRRNGFSADAYGFLGYARKELDSEYRITIPGYDAQAGYRSDVADDIFRGGMGMRLRYAFAPAPVSVWADGRLGFSHHSTSSAESFDLSIFNGAIGDAQRVDIGADNLGIMARVEAGVDVTAFSNVTLGVSGFAFHDTSGAITIDRPGGGARPAINYSGETAWGARGRLSVAFPVPAPPPP